MYPDRCMACGACVEICPDNAVATGPKGATIDRKRCTGCGECARICPTAARELVGQWIDLDELVEVLLRDRPYYTASGGGVTLSGGEPTVQMDFLGALLRRLREEEIHTVVETSGYFSMAAFSANCLDHLDEIFFDIKMLNPDRHMDATGRPNEVIWRNLAALQKLRPGVVTPRVPVIPGYTATVRNLGEIAARLKEMGLRRYTLLPYHPFGFSKAKRLDRQMPADLPQTPMGAETLKRWHDVFRKGAGATPSTADVIWESAPAN